MMEGATTAYTPVITATTADGSKVYTAKTVTTPTLNATSENENKYRVYWNIAKDGIASLEGATISVKLKEKLPDGSTDTPKESNTKEVKDVTTSVIVDGATVTGDAETGFVVKPSEEMTEVVVTIPDGVDAAKVTVKVSPETKRVTPNGAAVRVVRGTADITDYLVIPSAVGGVIDLSAATVKEEIAKEPFDADKGAKVDFSSPTTPSLTTAPTREGLVYRLKEGTTLEAMAADSDGATKVGDGNAWTPPITVTGGASGFYTIEVGK